MSGSPSGLIPKTNNSSLGLGAAGGARGVGAGVTQVLVNFILNYDRGRLAELSKQVKQFEAERDAASAKALAATTRIESLSKKVVDGERVRTSLTQDQQVKLNAIATTQSRINSLTVQAGRHGAAVGHVLDREKTLRTELIAQLVQETGFSEREIRNAAAQAGQVQRLLTLEERRVVASQQLATATQNVTAAQRAQSQLQNLTTGAASRIGSLGLGLIGGTIGGALVGGAIMGPLQGVIDSVVKGLQQIVDPANAAREAVKNLGDEVNRLADSDDISRLEAAARVLERISAIQPPGSQELNTPDNRALLERVAINAALTPLLQQQLDIYRAQHGMISGITAENRDILRNIELQKAGISDLASPYAAHNQILGLITGQFAGQLQLQQAIDGTINQQSDSLLDAGSKQEALARATEETKRALDEAAQAAASLSDELNTAAVADAVASNIAGIERNLSDAISRINQHHEYGVDAVRRRAESAAEAVGNAAEKRIEALQDRISNLELQPSGRTRSLERQLDALSDAGPSRRTRELAEAIERVNRAQEEASYRQALAEVAEQRQQILLRERLRLSKAQIDLDEYRGKDRLIAIDAMLDRLNRQNEAQQRFNKLLEIQYQMSQSVRREQGESIQEFTERRAQHYRGLLQQAAELQQGTRQDALQKERERVEASLDLKELEERRRKIIEDRARQQRLRDLQQQLEASRARDRAELESRRESLQKQLEASRRADQQALESRREAIQRQIEVVREGAQAQIERINNARDREIAARELARDRAIAAARRAAEAAIEAERNRSEILTRLASSTETAKLQAAFRGAATMADLQRYAGLVAGYAFQENYLYAAGAALGLDPATIGAMVANAARLRQAYANRMTELRALPYAGQRGFAEGGIFRLNNMNTPLGGDIRWGDAQGDELGMSLGHGLGAVLSNKVAEELRGSAGGNNFTFVAETRDPYSDRANFERMVRGIVRDEMN